MRRFLFRFVSRCALGLALVAAAGAGAQADETFTVSAIRVDASGASAVEARNAAIAGGREQAWQTLYRRLTRQQDWARQPKLDPQQLQRYITSYYPSAERRSTTRYVAEVTYTFNRDAVARLLQSAKIAYTVTQAKRVLLVPMAPGYGRWSGWTAALANPRLSGGLVPFVLPAGDAQDMAVLGGLPFENAGWSDIAAVAARRGANEAVLVQAIPSGDKLILTLRRLGPNQVPVKAGAETALLQGGAASTYAAAADIAVRTMDDLWKTRTAVDFSRKASLTAEVRLTSLDRFALEQRQLNQTPNVAEVSVQALNTGMARLTIVYQGTLEQLQESLTQAGFVLARQGEGWQLGRKSEVAP